MKPNKKIVVSLNEFINTMNSPAAPTTKPTTKPAEPGKAPARPSPIRRDKPSVDPAPKASEEQVINRLFKEIKNTKNSELINIIKSKHANKNV